MTAVHEASPIDKQVLYQVAMTLSELLPDIVIEKEYNVSGNGYFYAVCISQHAFMPYVRTCISVKGFCSQEQTQNQHGFFTWNETEVGSNDTQICEFGTKVVFTPGGQGKRHCKGPRLWADAYNDECLTENSKRLADVLMVW